MLYLIGADEDGPLKLGWAVDPRFRRVQLQTGNPQTLRLLAVAGVGDRKYETRLHQRYADRWIRGEWFNLTVEEVVNAEIGYHCTGWSRVTPNHALYLPVEGHSPSWNAPEHGRYKSRRY